MNFQRKPGEPLGEAMARCAKEALLAGPMGDKQRGEFYREFISCGMSPALTTAGDIGKVKTSCAVFVRAVMHWAGRRATRKGQIGAPMFNGWLEGMGNYGRAWNPVKPGERPDLPPGAVFYRDYGTITNMGHVGVIVQKMPTGNYITAEGGGGDGTECRLSTPKDVWAKDSLGRVIIGWWDPAKLTGDIAAPDAREWHEDAEGFVVVNEDTPTLPLGSLAVFRERVLRWLPAAKKAADKYKVPLHWILGVIWAESGGRPDVVSPDGGYGLMQLTHPAVFQGHTPQATLDDPELNIDLGTAVLAGLRVHLFGLPRVASGYNAGVPAPGQNYPSSVSPWGIRETAGHIDRVVAGANQALLEVKKVTHPLVPVKRGDRDSGPDGPVRRLQKALMAAGYALPKWGADGIYGAETASALQQMVRDRYDGGHASDWVLNLLT